VRDESAGIGVRIPAAPGSGKRRAEARDTFAAVPPPRDLLRSAILSLATLIVLAIVLESGVRLVVPQQYWRFRDATADWQLDPTLGWVNQPDLDVESRFQEVPIRFRTNRDGLIPATAAPERSRDTALRVMVFGDSMVVGREIPQDQTYTVRLEEQLRARGIRAEVINAGVQGYSTDQVLLLMQRWLPVYRPDLALYGSTHNDLGGIELDYANGQAKPHFAIEGDGSLRLLRPRLGAEIQRYGGGLRTWIQWSAFYRLLQPRIAMLRARFIGFDQRVMLGLYEEAYVRPGFADRVDWRLYGALVGRMRDTARDAGARFEFFAHPEVGEVWDPYIEQTCVNLGAARSQYDPHAMERRIIEVAREQRVEFVPLIDDFRSRQQRGPFHLLPTDAHLSPAGHELLAELLASRIASPTRLTPDAALR
jgi:lysophospholipase L1-like esterase